MLVGHFSDLHGDLGPLMYRDRNQKPDLWIWTGDMLPEDITRPMSKQPAVQHAWLIKHMNFFQSVFTDKPLLVVAGNHDWIDVVPWMKGAGIDARAVTLQIQEVLGFTYAGFPWITPVDNPPKDCEGKLIKWNNERFPGEMQDSMDSFFAGPTPELLITHSPPNDILDRARSGRHFGIPSLANKLLFGYNEVRYHFFGHIHESRGTLTEAGIFFSNAATGLQFIEVRK